MNTMVLVLALSAPAPGADLVAPLELSIAEAARLAVGAAERVRSAEQDLEKARGQIAEARAAALPQVNAELGYNRYSGTGGMFPPEFAMGLPNISSNYTATLKVQQLVYNGGIVIAALRAAALAEQQSEKGLELSRKGAVYAAQMAYAAVLMQSAMLEVATESRQLADAALKNAEALQGAGVSRTFDVLQARVERQLQVPREDLHELRREGVPLAQHLLGACAPRVLVVPAHHPLER